MGSILSIRRQILTMSAALRALLFLFTLLLTGCVGIAHVKVDMPPLVVQGVLIDQSGQPIANQVITVALSDFYAQERTFEALHGDMAAKDQHGYRYCEVHSGPQGEFVCRLPGESRYIGFMFPFHNPSEDTLKSFVLGVGLAPATVIGLVVTGSEVKMLVPQGNDFRLVAPGNDFPISVTASAVRSNVIDVLHIVLRTRGSGV